MSSILTNRGLTAAQKSLDALWLKQKVISGNLANIDTPGYKSQTVDFERMFENLLDLTAKNSDFIKKVEEIEPRVLQSDNTQLREDGNNVDIDSENIELTRTQLQYEYMVRAASADIARLKYVINEGR
jgi:flagellar basal-body rod protein FlgB